jgi:hypothetical protein
VPEEGLLRFTCKLLNELGLNHVQVKTYQDWTVDIARKTFGSSFESNINYDAQGEVVKFKRQDTLVDIFSSLASKRAELFSQKIKEFLGVSPSILDLKKNKSINLG